ncbi:MAG: sigma-70 family RNA polymerase sigma factor [Verrucomicrobiota bacterium]
MPSHLQNLYGTEEVVNGNSSASINRAGGTLILENGYGIGIKETSRLLVNIDREMSALDEHSDQDLMKQVAGGNEAAFELLVERYQDLVYGTCYRMLGSYHQETGDVAQQVFVRVYKAASRYKPKALFKTWLLTIVRNCVFTHLKKMKRQHEGKVPLQPEWEEGESEEVYPDPAMSDAAERVLERELEQTLLAAMDQLPEQQRMALVLRQYEQMDYQEIANTLKTTVSSVKSLIFRARDTMRMALKDYMEK